MARFYVRFDTKSQADLDGINGNYFDRKSNIGGSSASGAQFRDGLIASRSLLSLDIYEELDEINKDGSKGTYFPPDSGPFSTDSSTFVSWSTAYTSSINGIKTPSTNSYGEYGVSATINYSLRPTASVLSTNPGVGATTPLDPVKASYNTYISASRAVSASLAAVAGGGPFSRLGNNPSRTVHSIWHDPDLTYFAWDDFTPGQPTEIVVPNAISNHTSPSSSTVTIFFSASRQYINDTNPLGSASIQARLVDVIGDPFAPNKTLDVTVPISQLTASVDNSTVTYRWNVGTVIENGTLENGGNLEYVSWSFIDPLINTSVGEPNSTFRNTGATSNSGTCFFHIGTD